MSWGTEGTGWPTSGDNLVIAGLDNNGLLHFRAFNAFGVSTDTFETTVSGGAIDLETTDSSGYVLSDAPESSLAATQVSAIAALKQQLPGWYSPYVPTSAQVAQVLSEVKSILGQTLQATSAELDSPEGIAFDSAGDLFIADSGNNVIREVPETKQAAAALGVSIGDIVTVVGGGTMGYSGAGPTPAADAELDFPVGIAFNKSGDLFIADSGNNVIEEVAPGSGGLFIDGEDTTYAGDGTAGFSGDTGPATAAQLNGPEGIAFDTSGDLFIADTNNNRVREVVASSQPKIFTVAGDGTAGYTTGGSGDLATTAELDGPEGVELNGSDLFIADSGNNVIREETPVSGQFTDGTITTFAGDETSGYSGDGSLAITAELASPEGMAFDSNGDLFIADSGNNVIREVSGGNITTFAGGNGGLVYAPDNGFAATSATLDDPDGIAVDSAGDIFIADAGFNVVREVVHSSGKIDTIAGDGIAGYNGNAKAIDAELDDPTGLAVEGSGANEVLFIADTGADRILELNLNTGLIAAVAGDGISGYSGDGGTATAAELDDPTGVAVDTSGNLYIADEQNNVVREVTPKGIINTVVGDGVSGYGANGTAATAAELNSPESVAVDGAGDLFIADTGNDVIREVKPVNSLIKDGTIITVAGTYDNPSGTVIGGYSGDGGSPTSAFLNDPSAVAVDALGDIDIADTGNNAIRQVESGQMLSVKKASLTITAPSTSKTYGETTTFADTDFQAPVGLVNGDTVTYVNLVSAGAPASAAVGSYPIVPSSAVGTGLSNYNITYDNGTLTVNPASLTITAVSDSRYYNGTTADSLVPTYQVSGLASPVAPNTLLNNDSFTVLSQAFTSKKVIGTGGSTLQVSYTLNESGAAADYTVHVISATGTIIPEALTITAVPNTKVYDGTRSAASVPTITSGSLGPGDTANFIEVYNTSNVGTNLTLTPSGTVDDGDGGKDYILSFQSVSTGVITPEPLTIRAAPDTKVDDGTTSAAVLPTITKGSLQGSDTASFIETYASSGPANHITLTPSGVVNDGNGGNNYTYTFVPVNVGTITPAQQMAVTTTSRSTAQPMAVMVTTTSRTIVVRFSGPLGKYAKDGTRRQATASSRSTDRRTSRWPARNTALQRSR